MRELFELRAGGASYGDVLAHFEAATGRSSARQTVFAMLKNRAYLGELRYGRGADALVNAGAHAPIVELELFEAVQRVNEARSRRSGIRPAKAKSLLAGIAKCESAGGVSRGRVRAATSRAFTSVQAIRAIARRARISRRTRSRRTSSRPCSHGRGRAPTSSWSSSSSSTRAATVSSASISLAEAERLARRMVDQSRDAGPEPGRVSGRARGARATGRAAAPGARRARRGDRELEVARSTVRQAFAGDVLDVDERRRLLAVVLEAVIVRRIPYRGAPTVERVALRFRGGGGGGERAGERGRADRAELVDEAAA